jgi:hypothetical protein
MKVLTFNGEWVNKPKNIFHMPKVSHTVKPKRRLTLTEWGEIIYKQLKGERVNDVELITIKPNYMYNE